MIIQLFFIVNLFLSLLITIVVYSLPIFFYRFAIRRAPVEKKKAKKITLIYGACALVVMIFIVAAINKGGTVGGAIVLLGIVIVVAVFAVLNSRMNKK